MLNVSVKPFEKSLSHEPAVGVISTISTPAPSNPKAIIVLAGVQATLRAGVAAESVDLLIRDGASGVGTVIKRIPMQCVASGLDRLVLTHLTLPMTAGNVCTVEFSPAPTGTGFESVSIDYYSTDAMSNAQQYGVNG